MATNTKNFNFKKPDESDFYSIQDQNGNWDLADEELQKLNEPAFEDYTTGTSVPPAATALEALKSKIKLPVWMSNVVAFCKGCCTLAMIVNNCVSSDADKPLAAAQGKVLQDQLTKLYSDLNGSTQTTDILSDALKVGIGIHEYNLAGTLYTGILPSPNYAYGNGTVFKRNSTSIMVVLYGALQEPIATNYSSDGQKWLGWNQHALKFDLKSLENRINNTKRADNIEVFADGCEVGLTSFICHAETIGLPSSSYTSGTGLVLKRKQENVMVFLISTNTTISLKCKNEGGWRDWREIYYKVRFKSHKKS